MRYAGLLLIFLAIACGKSDERYLSDLSQRDLDYLRTKQSAKCIAATTTQFQMAQNHTPQAFTDFATKFESKFDNNLHLIYNRKIKTTQDSTTRTTDYEYIFFYRNNGSNVTDKTKLYYLIGTYVNNNLTLTSHGVTSEADNKKEIRDAWVDYCAYKLGELSFANYIMNFKTVKTDAASGNDVTTSDRDYTANFNFPFLLSKDPKNRDTTIKYTENNQVKKKTVKEVISFTTSSPLDFNTHSASETELCDYMNQRSAGSCLGSMTVAQMFNTLADIIDTTVAPALE